MCLEASRERERVTEGQEKRENGNLGWRKLSLS